MRNFFRIILWLVVILTVASVITVGAVGNYNDPSRPAVVRVMSDYLAVCVGSVGVVGIIASALLLSADKKKGGIVWRTDVPLIICFSLMLLIHVAVWIFVIYQYNR